MQEKADKAYLIANTNAHEIAFFLATPKGPVLGTVDILPGNRRDPLHAKDV